MANEPTDKSKSLEEEIKAWQEVYPTGENIIVDLRTETEINYKGNTVLLNDDFRKQANIRKAKSSISNQEIIEVETKETQHDKVQDKIKDLRTSVQQQENKPKLK